MKKLATLIATGSFTACMAAAPDRAEPTFSVSGVGLHDCSEWTETRAKAAAKDQGAVVEELFTLSWIQGFLNGMNTMGAGRLGSAVELPNSAQIRAFMDQYCAMKPTTKVLDASLQFYLVLEKAQRR